MKIIPIHDHPAFTSIRGGKDNLLLKNEKDLLKQLSDQLIIIHGGQYKPARRKG